MAARLPSIEPYDHGTLDTVDGNLVLMEAAEPGRQARASRDGGPGTGCSTGPRGPSTRPGTGPSCSTSAAGRSTPHVSDPAAT